MSRIELKHIDKFYGTNHVLRDINLVIEDGDFMSPAGALRLRARPPPFEWSPVWKSRRTAS